MPPVPRPPAARRGPDRNLVLAIAVAALVAAALIVGSIVLSGGGGTSAAPAQGSTEGRTTGAGASDGIAFLDGIPQHGTVLGNPGATVRLLQYEDLQCPICRRYTEDALQTIVEEYVRPGKVKLDFRGLAFLGADSDKALRIALAAGRQNRLWHVVELFYREQGEENSGWVTDAKVDEILGRVPGLDAAKVKRDAHSAGIAKEIAAVEAEAARRRIPGTPWFYIGVGTGEPYEVQPASLTPDAFRPALDGALQG